MPISIPCHTKMRRTCDGSHAIGHQHGDVARLLHHHHGERDQDVQCRHAHNESNHDKRDRLFLAQRMKQFLILLHPVGGHKAPAGGLLNLFSNPVGMVQIVDFEADDGDNVGLAE